MGHNRYTRNRPFLIITALKSGSNEYEQYEVVDSLKSRHWREATLIIDIFGKDVLKNRFSELSDQEILDSCFKKYNKEIAQGIQVWANKVSKDPGKLDRIADSFGKEFNI